MVSPATVSAYHLPHDLSKTPQLSPRKPDNELAPRLTNYKNPIRDIIAIGDGAAMTMFLLNITEKSSVENRSIEMFCASNEPGRGFPYSSANDLGYLMNTPINKLVSLTQSSSWSSLPEWIKDNYSTPQSHNINLAEEKIPRKIFGEYLSYVFFSCVNVLKKKGWNLTVHLNQAVNKVEKLDDGHLQIIDSENELIRSKQIFLAVGGMGVEQYAEQSLRTNVTYYPNHVGHAKEIKNIPDGSTIAVIGTGLSALDVVGNVFADESRDVNLYLLSRSGRLPMVRPKKMPEIQLQFFTIEQMTSDEIMPLTCEKIVNFINQELNEQGLCYSLNDFNNEKIGGSSSQDCVNWLTAQLDENSQQAITLSLFQAVIVQIRNTLMHLFESESIPADEQLKFRSQFEATIGMICAPMPQVTAEKLVKLLNANKLFFLQVIDGKKVINDGLISKEQTVVAQAQYVINCSGANRIIDFEKIHIPLAQSLLSNGLITAYKREGYSLGGINFNSRTGAATKDCIEHIEEYPTIYPVGQWIKGKQFNSDSIVMLRKATEKLAHTMLSQIYAVKLLMPKLTEYKEIGSKNYSPKNEQLQEKTG